VRVNIAPAKLRREATTIRELAEGTRGPSCTNRCWIFSIKRCFSIDLCEIMIHFRLRYSIPDAWTAEWTASLPVNGDLIVDPNVLGFDLQRHNWVLLRRFRIDGGS
jgi:hypothetical protein